jgi:membrane protein DedA with SNARE-associated domain
MIDWIQQIISNLDYTGLALLTFLENVFPPLPSEVIMPFAGFLVSRGQLLLVGVALAGTLGSLIGAMPLYYLGTKLNQERLERWMNRR